MRTILIAAHKPPPFHGQSFIVQQLLDGLPSENGGDYRILHLDVRFSTDTADIGRGGLRKVGLLLAFSLKLLAIRVKDSPDVFYYVPAPGKKIAVYRDWILVGLARLLGMRRVFHWLAGGLAEWVESKGSPVEKFLCKIVYGQAALSIIPVESERPNAAYFEPHAIKKLPTGIPDPCPFFEDILLPRRTERLASRLSIVGAAEIPSEECLRKAEASLAAAASDLNAPAETNDIFRVLFMAHCSEDKGLFIAMNAILLANDWMQKKRIPLRMRLDVFGQFPTDTDESQFDLLSNDPRWYSNLASGGKQKLLSHCRFVSGKEKEKVFSDADALCFPSYYAAEVIPTVVIDALAYGLPVVSTIWRGIPELLPVDGLAPCEIRNPIQVARRLIESLTASNFESYRKRFVNNFTAEVFLRAMSEALRG